MLVKFTTRGQVSLINVRHICGVRMDIDHKSGGEYMTRLFLISGQSVYVDSPINEVHKIINEVFDGKFEHDYSYDVPTVDSQMHQSFQRQQPYPNTPRYQRNDYRGNDNSYDRYDRRRNY